MSFGKKASKENTPKKVQSKRDTFRDKAIVEHIMYYVESTDAGCTNINRIKQNLSGVKNIDHYIDKCIKKYGYIKHKGLIYNRFWNADDINSVSNNIVPLENFDIYNKNFDEKLMKHLRQINGGSGANIKWLETLCDRGVLGMSTNDMVKSLKRLINEGRVYEPVVGAFVPLDFKN